MLHKPRAACRLYTAAGQVHATPRNHRSRRVTPRPLSPLTDVEQHGLRPRRGHQAARSTNSNMKPRRQDSLGFSVSPHRRTRPHSSVHRAGCLLYVLRGKRGRFVRRLINGRCVHRCLSSQVPQGYGERGQVDLRGERSRGHTTHWPRRPICPLLPHSALLPRAATKTKAVGATVGRGPFPFDILFAVDTSTAPHLQTCSVKTSSACGAWSFPPLPIP